MQDVTQKIVHSAIEADATIAPEFRRAFLAFMTTGAAPDRVLSPADVAARFNRSKRAISLWAKRGIIAPVLLPGRKRGCGYRESDICRLIASGTTAATKE